ncbi:MAG: RNA polymerase sigma factor [Planctomycetota bacterium]|nr:MAG: RNA polymerase sigma factor [Planctomycetota bacterium]
MKPGRGTGRKKAVGGGVPAGAGGGFLGPGFSVFPARRVVPVVSPHRPTGPEPPDALAAAAATGRPEAQAAWFRAEHPRVYRLCLGLLADPAAAEELAQDAMIHLLDRLDRRPPGSPYPAWRNRVVLNLCRDQARRRAARDRAEKAAAGRVPVAPPVLGPVERASAAELREILARTLAELPPREREAFVLRDLEGASTAEASAAMEVTAATVRSLLTLARRRLRRLLGPVLETGEAS